MMNQGNVSKRSALFYTMPEISDPEVNAEKIKKPDHQTPVSGSDVSGNDPHEALEVPPAYFLLKNFPPLLQGFALFYRLRWKATYPLQKRIPLQCKLCRKANISSVTYGEILWILPFIAILFFGIYTSFMNPNVFLSGHMARLPLAIAIVTASRNSIVTFLFGLPFERCIFYHKLAARLAFINGIFHTFVAYVDPYPGAIYGPPSNHTFQGDSPNFFLFAFDGRTNISGTCIFLLMAAIIAISLPVIRRRLFEVFQFLHVLFVLGMVCCAFFHSGSFVVILASISYGGDLLVRKVLMASILYPHKAYIKKLTETVLEISFPKTKSINYNPGQYLLIAAPEISFFEWHPFSISSSPHQDVVTLNIQVCGKWTRELEKLAEKTEYINILLEGPYGSLGVDLISKDRYQMIMFLSGGIGVTPMQSICHQLMYEYTIGKRELKRIWFLWTARDFDILENMEVSRRSIAGNDSALQRTRSLDSVFSELTEDQLQPDCQLPSPQTATTPQMHFEPNSLLGGNVTREELYQMRHNSTTATVVEPKTNNGSENIAQMLSISETVANILLPQYPPVRPSPEQKQTEEEEYYNALEEHSVRGSINLEYTASEDDHEQNSFNSCKDISAAVDLEAGSSLFTHPKYCSDLSDLFDLKPTSLSPVNGTTVKGLEAGVSSSLFTEVSSILGDGIEGAAIDNAKNSSPRVDPHYHGPLRLELFLTGNKAKQRDSLLSQFLSLGRPNFKRSFEAMREEAMKKGEKRIAVCVCAPAIVVKLRKQACTEYSDRSVRFDFHSETFG
jgi:predicted ferric reductase